MITKEHYKMLKNEQLNITFVKNYYFSKLKLIIK